MKKLMVFGFSSIFLFFIFLFAGLVSAVRINEVMANPADNCYDCTEWIELYSDAPLNLNNWIINTTNEKTNFSFNIEDYLIITQNKTAFLSYWNVNESKIIEWRGISLLNSGESIFLFNNSFTLIDSIIYPSLSSNKTYSILSNSSWIICDKPTPGSENSCTFQNNTQNSSQNNSQQNNTNNTKEASISLELDWNEDDIINGEEFDIEVKAYNLKNENYDIKVYVTFEDDNTIISEIYNEEDDKWKSSTYYVENIISGSGDKSATLSLRIKSSYRNFSGDAEIIAKIRKTGSSSIIDEVKEDIEILGNEEESDNKNNTSKTQKISEPAEENEEKTAPITGGVIKLGNRQAEIKNEKENVLYESASEKIKKYSIYGLNLILIIILIFLLKRKGFKTQFAKE